MADYECYLNGYIKFSEVVNFIIQKYDVGAKAASCKQKSSSYYDEGHYTKLGDVKFKYNGSKVRLRYSYSNFLTRQEQDSAERGNKNFWLSKKTELYTNDPRVKSVLDEILLHFGGTKVTRNKIEHIKAQPDESIKPILTISHKKLRKTFGGVYVKVK